MILTTLNFLLNEKRILLAMKKRRFGTGKWNGVGGKLLEGENLEDSIIRETREEIEVRVKKEDLEKVGVINFYFNDHLDWNQECHVYLTKRWEGEPVETEEMRPEWFDFDKIPYENMWVDDKHWLPKVLEGKKIKAEFYFNEEGKVLEKWECKEV